MKCFAAALFSLICFQSVLAAQPPPQAPAKPTPDVQKLLDAADSIKNPKDQLPAYQRALEKAKASSDLVGEGAALNSLGQCADNLGQEQQALDYYNQALPIRRQTGDRLGEAITLTNIGVVYGNLGNGKRALVCYQQCLPIFKEVGDQFFQGVALNNIGYVYHTLGQEDKALDCYNQALPIKRQMGDKSGEASVLGNIGSVYYTLGQEQKAFDFYNQALQITKQIGDKSQEGNTLNNIGTVYEKLGSQDKALDSFNQSLDIMKEIGDVRRQAIGLCNIGAIYANIGQEQKALDYYNQAIAPERQIGDKDAEATTLDNIGIAYWHLGQGQNALDALNQSLPIFQEVGDKNMEATALNNIATISWSLGQGQNAIEKFNRAVAILHQTGNKDAEATALNNIGLVYDRMGQGDKALDFYGQALPIFTAVGNKKMEATELNNIGHIYQSFDQDQKALDYYGQALPLFTTAGDRSGEGGDLVNMGSVFDDLGQEENALDYYNRALPIQQDIGDAHNEAINLTNIGAIYNNLGQEQKSLDFYNQAIQIERKANDKNEEATTLNNIGIVSSKLGLNEKALGFYNQALPLLREAGNRTMEATTLNNIGYAYEDMGQQDKALDYYGQALAIQEQAGDRSGEATSLSNMGVLYNQMEQPQKALPILAKVVPLKRETGDRRGEALALSNLAFVLNASGKTDSAIVFDKESVNVYQSLRKSVQGLPSSTQASYKQGIVFSYQALSGHLAAAGRVPEAIEALDLIEDEKYQEFLATRGSDVASVDVRLEFAPAEQKFLDGYEAGGQALKELGDKLALLQRNSARTPEENAQLKDLDARADQAALEMVAAISSGEETLKGSGADKLERTPEQSELQALLGKEQGLAAVYAWADDKQIHLLVVGVQGASHAVGDIKSVLGKTTLAQAILAYAEGLRSDRYDMRPLGSQLYALLVAPIADELKGCKTVLWCTEGILRYVPIDALYDAKTDKYAIQEFASALFTPTMLKDLESSRAQRTEWKGVGFGVSEGHPGFDPLPNVKSELEQIFQPQVLPGQDFVDESFTESSLEAALSARPDVVHIASHFSFDPDKGLDSFLLLGDGSHFSLGELNAKKGFFKGVDLLALSACQTGVGAPGADGSEVEGFALLAQNQGARSVLSTLWPVEDESTASLMADFYRIRHNNRSISKVEALRQAQLDMLEGRQSVSLKKRSPDVQNDTNLDLPPYPSNLPRSAHPYYWAGFTLAGDWQ